MHGHLALYGSYCCGNYVPCSAISLLPCPDESFVGWGVKQRRFSKLDSGCNGLVFVQMRKRDGDPSPKDIVQYIMTSLASSRKHVSRFVSLTM